MSNRRTIGGTVFCYNAIIQDYCLTEAVACLKECCDKVVVLDAGSIDGTTDLIKSFEDEKTKVVLISNEEWLEQQGKTKLAYFTNKAAAELDTDYQFNLQADEILHEDSYPALRKAIRTNQEAFLVKRINLWASPYLMLDVPQNRKPCSTEIVRLAKIQYQSYDDAESLAAPGINSFLNDIRIYHMGFVRDRKKMVEKTINMQRNIFQVDPDVRVAGFDEFDPWKFFQQSDLKPIEEPLPKLIQQWAADRFVIDN